VANRSGAAAPRLGGHRQLWTWPSAARHDEDAGLGRAQFTGKRFDGEGHEMSKDQPIDVRDSRSGTP
jgi:hypothetical protein